MRRGRELLDLTGIEFAILLALSRRAGRVVPREALLSEAGRGDIGVGDRTVDVHVSHLRRKLGDVSRTPYVDQNSARRGLCDGEGCGVRKAPHFDPCGPPWRKHARRGNRGAIGSWNALRDVLRFYYGAHLHRRLFLWFGLAIFATVGTVELIGRWHDAGWANRPHP